MRLRKKTEIGEHKTVPKHKEIAKGTLKYSIKGVSMEQHIQRGISQNVIKNMRGGYMTHELS